MDGCLFVKAFTASAKSGSAVSVRAPGLHGGAHLTDREYRPVNISACSPAAGSAVFWCKRDRGLHYRRGPPAKARIPHYYDRWR